MRKNKTKRHEKPFEGRSAKCSCGHTRDEHAYYRYLPCAWSRHGHRYYVGCSKCDCRDFATKPEEGATMANAMVWAAFENVLTNLASAVEKNAATNRLGEAYRMAREFLILLRTESLDHLPSVLVCAPLEHAVLADHAGLYRIRESTRGSNGSWDYAVYVNDQLVVNIKRPAPQERK